MFFVLTACPFSSSGWHIRKEYKKKYFSRHKTFPKNPKLINKSEPVQ